MEKLHETGPRTSEPISALRNRVVTVSIVGSFLLLLMGALYYARGFFLPVVLAALVTMTFLPFVRYLARRGLHPAFSAILLMVTLAGIVLGSAAILASPVSRMFSEAPHIGAALRDRFSFLQEPMAMIAAASEQVRSIAEPGADSAQHVVLDQPGLLSWAADTLTGIGATIGATLILAIFLLSSGDIFLQKLVRAVPSLSDKKRSLRIVHDVQTEVSRYLLTITVINICFGLAVGSAMALLGMPNAVAWGLAGFLLNYIPFVGAITGIALSAAVALIAFPTLAGAALPPIAYLALHATESTVVTPLILGRRLELNAVAILLALALCGWMWGIVGALLAVPLLVVTRVFCDHFPGLATFGDFLSAESPIDTEEDAEAAAVVRTTAQPS